MEDTLVGTLELITGPMFSGKSSELLRRLFTESEVGLNVLYINHSSDTRSKGPFSTHNPLYKEQLSARPNVSFLSTSSLSSIFNIEQYDIIGIDEAQFFDDLYETVKLWVETHNKHLIVAGLSCDFRREKFGSILDLEPLADEYMKLTSYCKLCARIKKRSIAPFTRKISGDSSTTKEIGGSDKYISVCRKCYLA